MSVRATATIIFAVFILSACTVIPGSHLRVGSGVTSGDADNNTDIVYHDITAELIIENAMKKQRAVMDTSALFESDNTAYQYRVGVGDVLSIVVWENPSSFARAEDAGSPAYEIYADGNVFFPYLGLVPVGGLTIPEIRQEITQRISRIISRPSVDVSVLQYNSQKVYLAGAIGGGEIPLDNKKMTLLRAMQQAGGATEQADLSNVSLTRGNKTTTFSLSDFYKAGAPTSKIVLQADDIVYFPSVTERRVVVLGDAGQGVKPIGQNGMSLAELMGVSGGINQRSADASGVFVLRGLGVSDANGAPRYRADVYRLNVKSASNFLLATQFAMQPKDIVFVTTAPVNRWNALISALLPTLFSVDRLDELTTN